MTEMDVDDSLTKLNTQLNKSMVLMDTTIESDTYTPKSNKSIKINTKIQPANSNSPPVSRKSILKKTDAKTNGKRYSTDADITKSNKETLNHMKQSETSMDTSGGLRPHNIDELVRQEELIVETTDATFNLDDISDNEDIWIMDIPMTVDPQDLVGQTLVFGEKSKLKVKEERYCAVKHNARCNVTCVFNTEKGKSQYQAVNVKPAGAITVRRKLSGISKIEPMHIEDTSVPFPKNLKTRHPLFGVSCKGNDKKCEVK